MKKENSASRGRKTPGWRVEALSGVCCRGVDASSGRRPCRAGAARDGRPYSSFQNLKVLGNGQGRKLGRPGGTTAPCHDRSYKLNLIGSGRRQWRHEGSSSAFLRKISPEDNPEDHLKREVNELLLRLWTT